jgi:hypothetical protein
MIPYKLLGKGHKKVNILILGSDCSKKYKKANDIDYDMPKDSVDHIYRTFKNPKVY